LLLYRITHQSDKKSTRGNRAVYSPTGSHKSGYHAAPRHVSLANDEDLRQGIFSLLDASESIHLQSFENGAEGQGRRNNIQETYILDKRPPVEGGDSSNKDNIDREDNPKLQNMNDGFHYANYVYPSGSSVATVRELRCARPAIEPLPLLQRGGTVDHVSPGSQVVSPFTKTHLFMDDSVESPLSDVVADDTNVDLEYDDYMPQLPGSYFTMDPQAYTLTWSKKPPWAHQPVISRTASDTSVDQNTATTQQN